MSDVRPEWYQLRDALEQADFVTAAALVEKVPPLIDERNGIGETVLHFLAVENNQPAVEWLHARRADLNATNKFGTPLLFEVADLGYRDLLVWLLQHGANPTKKKSDGQTLEEHLAERGETDMIAFIKEYVTPTA